jgi:hypothetical protein
LIHFLSHFQLRISDRHDTSQVYDEMIGRKKPLESILFYTSYASLEDMNLYKMNDEIANRILKICTCREKGYFMFIRINFLCRNLYFSFVYLKKNKMISLTNFSIFYTHISNNVILCLAKTISQIS